MQAGIVVELTPSNSVIELGTVVELTPSNLVVELTPSNLVVELGTAQGPSGAIALGEHLEAHDPHPQYTTADEVAQLMTAASTNQSSGFPASIALSALRVVTLESGQWIYASSDRVNHGSRAIALLQTATNQDGLAKALLQGLAADPNWNWMADQPIFLGLNGLLTQAEPAFAFWRVAAFAISPTQIFFNPQEAIFLCPPIDF